MVVNLPTARVGDTLDDLAPVDMDMDGKTDILAIKRTHCDTNLSGHNQLYRFNATDFIPTINDGSETYAVCNTPLANRRPTGLQTADLNADGLPDLIRSWRHVNATEVTPAEWAWRLNPLGTTGTLNFPAYTPLGILSGLEHAGLVVDVDGDGASELLLRKPQSSARENPCESVLTWCRDSEGRITVPRATPNMPSGNSSNRSLCASQDCDPVIR